MTFQTRMNIYDVIRSIPLVVIVVASSLAAFGPESATAVIAILFGLGVYLTARESGRTRLVRVVAVLVGLAGVVGLVPPVVKNGLKTVRCMACEGNLRQIGIAVRNYWNRYGCYPPTCTYDKAGRPMHSWRLLILPEWDPSSTYYNCNFDEPWDSPSNRKLLADRKSLYKCMADKTAYANGSTTTSYVAIVGNRARWLHRTAESPNNDSRDQKQHDQETGAFLVIETHDSGIQWTEPKDIDLDDIPALESIAPRSSHARDNGYFYCKTPAVNAVLVNGDMVFTFPWDSRTSVLTGLLRPRVLLLPPDERDRIERSEGKYDPYSKLFQEELHFDWLHVVGLPVWIVAIALSAYQSIAKSRRDL